MRLNADHAGIGARQCHAIADAYERERNEELIVAAEIKLKEQVCNGDADKRDHIAGQHHHRDADAAGVAAGNEVAQHISCRHEEELHAQHRWRQPIEHAADERRAAEKGEKQAGGERAGQCIAPESGGAKKLRPGLELGCETCRLLPVGFAHVEKDEQQNRHRRQADKGEACLPAGEIIEKAANGGPDHRHHRHAHGDVADHRGRLLGRHHVTNDGSRQNEARGDSRLQNAANHEDGDVRGECADQRGDNHQHDADEHNWSATEEIGKRSDHELKHGSGGEIA